MADNKQFNCNQCELSFAQKKLLTKHILESHELLEIECDLCDTIFHSTDRIAYHHKQYHSIRSNGTYRNNDKSKPHIRLPIS